MWQFVIFTTLRCTASLKSASITKPCSKWLPSVVHSLAVHGPNSEFNICNLEALSSPLPPCIPPSSLDHAIESSIPAAVSLSADNTSTFVAKRCNNSEVRPDHVCITAWKCSEQRPWNSKAHQLHCQCCMRYDLCDHIPICTSVS